MQARALNGRYRLDERIGEGGMAVVYRGYDLVLNRVVAVKVLRDQYISDSNFLRRFEREAQSAARLSHPHIANVYDVGQDGHTRYIVMEYVDGPNLKELIRRQGPFSVDGAAFIIRQVAEALDYAHAHGLVHRDIKPQNILVDQDGHVKVVDFGIAKGLSDANLTEDGTGMGTVHYVSPEQARGAQATPASDVYATGVVLYEMLTKRLPFEADTPVGVAMQHVSASPPPPRQFNPAIPPEVEAIVLRALAKNPADRYPSAGALADALDHWERAGTADSEATRVIATAPAAVDRPPRRAATAVPPGRTGRGAPPPPPARNQAFRDDVGCVTWLIGSAILIGLVGLVVLVFNVGDFGFFEPSNQPTPTATMPAAVASPTTGSTPTSTATATTPATPSPTGTPGTPTPTPSPTPEMATVPWLIGSTVDQVEETVNGLGFTLVEERVYDNVEPPGTIIDQEPRAGESVPKGTQIQVKVSRGPEYISLQSVVGLPRAQARQQLEQLGLTVNEVEEGSATVPRGNVIRTDPPSQVANGGTVTLYISVGDQIQVPDAFGQPYPQVVAALENAGFVVESVVPQTCEQIQQSAPDFDCQNLADGAVVSATLAWGSWVPRGSSIAIAYYDAGDD
ncbi:protein kinase [Sphaerobacter sp.]|uniref:protein kinase domain-containing protein n=1 Tax=Sphaerobacter sp. TaxID=2099654 RepID=UPI001DD75B85|nr:protein kinase [Sphaerobacter sp.]MBX5443950.1 protein kinase [Sphaerobacter sp.]